MFLALGRSFDQWVGSRLQFDHCSRSIQRVVRGFIDRARSAVTRAVVHRSVVLQSASRWVIQRRKHVHLRYRIHWAAITLQRHVRGMRGGGGCGPSRWLCMMRGCGHSSARRRSTSRRAGRVPPRVCSTSRAGVCLAI